MDRELLLEIGCEELPARWLPALTTQLGEAVAAELAGRRLALETPVETFSTPRRLTARVARLAERQTDLEELVTGPPASAGFSKSGEPTAAAVGFASRQKVAVAALERVETPKGTYLAYRRKQQGKPAEDVLAEVLGGTLRRLTFPKPMHWDAALEDGHGELLFGRPIRWILYLYGGRVVPFTISRLPEARTSQVQDVTSGAVTYGHRFLTTGGTAGLPLEVRSFDEYRDRLLESFVILDRGERHDRIVRELDAAADRLQSRVSRAGGRDSDLLREVPDLVEYPSVVAGSFAAEFLDLPEEVLTTTLVHHQHYFPVETEDGRLTNAFLAVINNKTDNEAGIARNAERVVVARLRDAQFFWESDRTVPLASRSDRLATLQFHKNLGTYRDKTDRIAGLARWIASTALGADDRLATQAEEAARLAKADLATDMVREFTELQGTMGGVYAREEGLPEEVWKAIYFHYLPTGVEADAPPRGADLGRAGVTWAAVSLADKLDTIVGLFACGERPTGSRDPYGLRRAAHGVVKVLADLPELGVDRTPTLAALVQRAVEHGLSRPDESDVQAERTIFWLDRLEHLLRQRGISDGAIRAVLHRRREDISPLDVLRRGQAVEAMRRQTEFVDLARLFKRVNNIVHAEVGDSGGAGWHGTGRGLLKEPTEVALRTRLDELGPQVHRLAESGRYVDALHLASGLAPLVDRFFTDVLVMVEDPALREARLALLAELRDLVWEIADIPAVVQEQGSPESRAPDRN